MIERMQYRASLVYILLLAGAGLPALGASEPCLGDTHNWFQLSEDVARGEPSQLCKGVLDASLERRAAAERELKAVVRRMPRTESSYTARDSLANMNFRDGRYRDAHRQIEQMIAEKPAAEDAKAAQSLFAAAARFPDLTVESSEPSTVQGEMIEGNLFVPVTANGVSGNYMVDTGAGISVMSESEAQRLRLKVVKTTATVSDMTASVGVRVAEAPDLWIGKTHLRHVVFAVYPDANDPLIELPEGHRGVLGIQVLIALGSFRVSKENRFDIQAGAAPAPAKVMPMAFDGDIPVAQMTVDGKDLTFTLDTGAVHTYLGPVFAAQFPELMRAGHKEDHTQTGLSRSAVQESVVLPSVRFSFGKKVELDSATVLLKTTTSTSSWAAGNLGFDLISQVLPIMIDFRAMQLIFEDR
jgi:predicted aspartyl protease